MCRDLQNVERFNEIEDLTIFGNVYLHYLPKNLKYLYCSHNHSLYYLPNLPSGLIRLDCSNTNLSWLPNLPNSLTYIDCSKNQLSNLPDLPNSLIHLNCSENKLSQLPKLPHNLRRLDCYENKLLNLPKLPNYLKYLNCYQNQLSYLPELPNSITKLYCTDNPFNLWHILIDKIKINGDLTEFMCEKLSKINDQIEELHYDLNQNKFRQYNKKISNLTTEIDNIINVNYEIIL
jgi:Leucine-rich repeat (LRR) protein